MVAALVLAAGASTRFGTNKLLLPFGASPLGASTVVEAAVANVLHSRARPVVVVTGHDAARLRQALNGLPVTYVHNPDYQAGEMLSSIQAGLVFLQHHNPPPAAALIALADQPLIPSQVFDRLITAFERGCGEIIAPRFKHDGPRGHPVLIGQSVWADVLALPAGANVRDLLRARPHSVTHLVVNTDAILRDVDTPQAYEEALQCLTRK
ncbi:MAG: nucleotidyltransferase family protein [Anaerolineae bacterium]|nr:nucleotidyltransferase family protein [Thermoflexales bacterium]MDW8406149.1 nucleotidyltransferase family protein [Anaerolineae bacterium]